MITLHVAIVTLMYLSQDGGSLDLILNTGRIPVDMIGKITVAVSYGASPSLIPEPSNTHTGHMSPCLIVMPVMGMTLVCYH